MTDFGRYDAGEFVVSEGQAADSALAVEVDSPPFVEGRIGEPFVVVVPVIAVGRVV